MVPPEPTRYASPRTVLAGPECVNVALPPRPVGIGPPANASNVVTNVVEFSGSVTVLVYVAEPPNDSLTVSVPVIATPVVFCSPHCVA